MKDPIIPTVEAIEDLQRCIDYWGRRTEKAEAENAKLRAALSTAIDWIDPESDPMPLKNGEIVTLLRMVLRFNDEQKANPDG